MKVYLAPIGDMVGAVVCPRNSQHPSIMPSSQMQKAFYYKNKRLTQSQLIRTMYHCHILIKSQHFRTSNITCRVHLNDWTNFKHHCITNTVRIRCSKHMSKAQSFTLSQESRTGAYDFSTILLTDLVKKNAYKCRNMLLTMNVHYDNNYSDLILLIYDKPICLAFLVRPIKITKGMYDVNKEVFF